MTIFDDAKAGMNHGIRPQDDLFGHVNGHWLDTAEIPLDRSSWGPFVMLADNSEQQVRAIIEGLAEAAPDDLDESGRQIGDLYASFMDEARAEELGATPIAPALEAVDQVTGLGQLAQFVGEIERAGGTGLFGSYVDSDDRDSERYVVKILQGGLGLPDESYYRDEKFADIRAAYLKHMSKMFALAGRLDPDSAARQVLDVETRLAQGHWERVDTRDVIKTYNLMTLDELREAAPNFDWSTWASALGTTDETFAETVVRQPSYFTHLSTALEELPLEHWRAWLALRVIQAAAPYLASDFVDENFAFYGKTLNGTPELRARWKRGVALIEGALGEAVGEIYVERHFPPASKALMDGLVDNLIEAYRRNIENLDWMGPDTKKRAFEKLKTFRPKIGYPEKFRDYSALKIDPTDLLGNVTRGAAFETDRQLRKIGAPVDRDEWLLLPQTVNAYYKPTPTRSASRPGSCRSRSSHPTRTRPRTTAGSVP